MSFAAFRPPISFPVPRALSPPPEAYGQYLKQQQENLKNALDPLAGLFQALSAGALWMLTHKEVLGIMAAMGLGVMAYGAARRADRP